MIALLLEAFPGAELLDVDESDLLGAGTCCTWAGCERNDGLVMSGVRSDPWCLEHATDDCLPATFPSERGLAACQQCGRGTSRVLADGTPMHDGCRRDHKARRATAAAPKGAYARRKGAYARRAAAVSSSSTTG